jgi:hypothetical protein
MIDFKDLLWEIKCFFTGDINWYRANKIGLYKLTKEQRYANLERLKTLDIEAYNHGVAYDIERGWREK